MRPYDHRCATCAHNIWQNEAVGDCQVFRKDVRHDDTRDCEHWTSANEEEMSDLHPARRLPFDDLLAGLEAARAKSLISRKDDLDTGRAIFCYTQRCVFERAWDDFTLMARGLILDVRNRRVIATPFPKFFNHGEQDQTIPDMGFEVFEKLDGSLAIIHYHAGRWRVATKGAFDSTQARWADARITEEIARYLIPGITYLAEAIYPENRIVVHYPEPALVLLAAYFDDGSEATYAALQAMAAPLRWRVATRHEFGSFADLVTATKVLPVTEEGFVIRFDNGLRMKLKGDEYRRVHALISRCTPLAMWEAMQAGDDMQAIRRDLPEEFWSDFDQITAILTTTISDIQNRVAETASSVAGWSDKEVGLALKTFPEDVRSFLFPYRKGGNRLDGKAMQSLYRSIRPTGNLLPEYQPSYSMARVTEEAGG